MPRIPLCICNTHIIIVALLYDEYSPGVDHGRGGRCRWFWGLQSLSCRPAGTSVIAIEGGSPTKVGDTGFPGQGVFPIGLHTCLALEPQSVPPPSLSL
jgi:hypothetical protein